MKVDELANATGQAILDNLLDRRGIKQALREIDADVMDELRQTIGAIALAAVIPAIQAEALERAAVVAKAHFPPECPVHNPNDEWAKGYNEALRAICPNVVAAIRALKEET